MKLLGKLIFLAAILWIGSYIALRTFGVEEKRGLNKILNLIDVQYIEVPEPLASMVEIYEPLVALDGKLTGTKIKLATPMEKR